MQPLINALHNLLKPIYCHSGKIRLNKFVLAWLGTHITHGIEIWMYFRLHHIMRYRETRSNIFFLGTIRNAYHGISRCREGVEWKPYIMVVVGIHHVMCKDTVTHIVLALLFRYALMPPGRQRKKCFNVMINRSCHVYHGDGTKWIMPKDLKEANNSNMLILVVTLITSWRVYMSKSLRYGLKAVKHVQYNVWVILHISGRQAHEQHVCWAFLRFEC